MPPHKGRRRRPARDRDRAPARDADRTSPPQSTPDAARTPGRASADAPIASSIPALRVRYFAFIVAVLTLFLGILTLAQGVLGDYAAADAALRIGAGVILIAVAVVIGVLALFPARIAARLRR